MKKYLSLLFVVVSFAACKKDSGNIEPKNITTLNKEEISLIGKEHNRLLIDIIKNLNNPTVSATVKVNSVGNIKRDYISDENLLFSINFVLSTNNYSPLQQSAFDDYIQNYNSDAIDNTISNTISSIINEVESSIMNDLVMNVYNSSSYSALSQNLEFLKQRAGNDLSGLEQTSTLIAIEVAQNSAYMWMPVNQGGLGYFDQLNIDLSTNNKTEEFQIKYIKIDNIVSNNPFVKVEGGAKTAGKVIVADAIGAYIGFLRAALPYFLSGGPANPISNGVLLGASLIAGVGTSATTAVNAIAK